MINSNLGPILHRFGDTAVYWSKNRQNRQFVPTPVSEIALARGRPLSNFVMNQIFLETRMFRLSDGEEIMTLAFFVLIQYRSETDGRTDGHRCSGYTSACIACYANALVKIQDHNEEKCIHCGQLILRKISKPKIGDTIGQILRLKSTKFDFLRWGSAPPGQLTVLRRPSSCI